MWRAAPLSVDADRAGRLAVHDLGVAAELAIGFLALAGDVALGFEVAFEDAGAFALALVGAGLAGVGIGDDAGRDLRLADGLDATALGRALGDQVVRRRRGGLGRRRAGAQQ